MLIKKLSEKGSIAPREIINFASPPANVLP